MNLSTFWSRVEVGSLCQVFVTVKNMYKIPSETVGEQVAAVSVLSRGNSWNYCHKTKRTTVIRPADWSWGIYLVARYFLLSIGCFSEWKVDLLWQLSISFSQEGYGQRWENSVVLSLHIWPWILAICEQQSLFTCFEEIDLTLYTQWAFWKCFLANDTVCFWGQVWKGVLLAEMCYLKIIPGNNNNSRMLRHFGTPY